MRTLPWWYRLPVGALAVLAVATALFSGCQANSPADKEPPPPSRAAADGLTTNGAKTPGDK